VDFGHLSARIQIVVPGSRLVDDHALLMAGLSFD